MDFQFTDRIDAGRRLASRTTELTFLRAGDPIVLGLPRGGVPVAAEVARALGAPLDVVLVRKLGVPSQPELAMGAVGEGGVEVLNPDVIRRAGVTDVELAAVRTAESAELDRRARRYRGDRPPVPLAGRTAVLVDDGIATGATAAAACRVVRAAGAERIVLATPVAPRGWTARFSGIADDLVCVHPAGDFYGIGQFYEDFSQTQDTEVIAALSAASA
jgi:predicted phosphoribosyltransferase